MIFETWIFQQNWRFCLTVLSLSRSACSMVVKLRPKSSLKSWQLDDGNFASDHKAQYWAHESSLRILTDADTLNQLNHKEIRMFSNLKKLKVETKLTNIVILYVNNS